MKLHISRTAFPRRGLLPFFAFVLAPLSAHAAELAASDAEWGINGFDANVSLSGNTALVSAGDKHAAYLFHHLDTASGTVTENVRLTASDGEGPRPFGQSVSLSGNIALVGTSWHDVDTLTTRNAAYVFRNLDTASGIVTENARLITSDGGSLGSDPALSLSGNTALVGAEYTYDGGGLGGGPGAAYLFRNLDTASGTVTEDVKLIASAPGFGDRFGQSVSLSGDIALVGASWLDADSLTTHSAAYVFRNLGTASGTVTEDARLIASDGGPAWSAPAVSLSGSTALIGAEHDEDGMAGAAYLFRNLDTASGDVTEDVKLTASDRGLGDGFGQSLSLSGNTALVGARPGTGNGAAYLFRDLDTASGTITESVRLTASDRDGGMFVSGFGRSVSIDGDQFVIGTSDQAYTGTVSSLTTLDAGNASRVISGISFESREDWVIGQTTSGNTVTLSAGDTAHVTAAGKAVYIGQEAGSDGNALIIAGHLIANEVFIGSLDGNEGNSLFLQTTATFDIGSIYLAEGNSLTLEGDYADAGDFFDYLGGATLFVHDAGDWLAVTLANHGGLIAFDFDGGHTYITASAVPEPATFAALLGALAFGGTLARRRKARPTASAEL